MKVFIALLCLISSAYAWNYAMQGADWGSEMDSSGELLYPECNGDRQSPIDIVREKTILYEGDDMLDFSFNYCDEISGYFKNNGHTIQFDPDCDGDDSQDDPLANVYMTGGPLGTMKYHFWQFHFHWGSSTTDGSEHLIDGVRNAAEVHLVHVREDYINNIPGALADSEGLAVLGIFIEGGADDDADTAWFDPIAYAALAITEEGDYQHTVRNETGLNLNKMVQKINPAFKADFNYWHLQGSLTTPPCSEAGHFIISERALAITDFQMSTFWDLTESDDSTVLIDTYREAMPDNCRKISYVHKNTDTEYTYTSPFNAKA